MDNGHRPERLVHQCYGTARQSRRPQEARERSTPCVAAAILDFCHRPVRRGRAGLRLSDWLTQMRTPVSMATVHWQSSADDFQSNRECSMQCIELGDALTRAG